MTGEQQATTELVSRAVGGDQRAWCSIVDRFAPLLWSVCRRFRLSDADAADVVQSVWLLLVEHLPQLREAAALPGWLVTTTRRECLRVTTNTRSATLPLAIDIAADEEGTAVDAQILSAERRVAVRAALSELPPHCRALLAVLVQEPPISYADVSSQLGMPVGSIGPTRARCLNKLRSDPALTAFMQIDARESPRGDRHA